MAAILEVDVSSANRFVSSLSKSLQALCHGCMDFDTQIEIIGYLNVSIDCNGKVDCVLNEKVSKSQDNSMTFISNSFLAKKDEPKSLCERSCSPIAELNTRSHYQGKDGALSNSSSQHYRSSGIFSPHSQIVGGAQKSPWRGSQRRGVKSARLQDPHRNQSFHDGFTQQSTSFSDTSASKTYFDHSTSNPSQKDVHIKTENPETLMDSSHSNTSFSNNQPTATTNINIKPDPDSVDTFQSQSNFLQTTADPNSGEQSFFKTEPVSAEDRNPESETVKQNVESDDGNGFSGARTDDDELEEQRYSQSVLGDECDNDVIEIDDAEDDDMEQFTRDSGLDTTETNNAFQQRQLEYQSGGSQRTSFEMMENLRVQTLSFPYDPQNKKFRCPLCNQVFSVRGSAIRHYKNIHQKVFDYTCEICGKGLQSKTDYLSHLVSHGMSMKYQCNICGKRYVSKRSLRNHTVISHGFS